MSYVGNAGTYLIETIVGFYLYMVILRFWMQWVHAGFRNPIGQFIISATNPLVIPLRKILPSIGSLDTATVVLSFVIAFAKLYVILQILGAQTNWLGMTIYTLGELIRMSIHIFIAAIFVQIIMSWINPHTYHPILDITRSISEPLLAPARRILPSMSGLDLSPMAVLIFLQLSLILVVAPLQDMLTI